MSMSSSHPPEPGPSGVHGARDAGFNLRFGSALGGDAVEWILKRNCSITPMQTLAAYAGMCLLSLVVAAGSWSLGARLVMPFASAEVLAVGAALWVFVRHASDRERIALHQGRLTIEYVNGQQVTTTAFAVGGLRVRPGAARGALIEVTGRGGRCLVGRYVRPELRPMLADELRRVLGAAPSMAQLATV